jgi:hypothetical protein
LGTLEEHNYSGYLTVEKDGGENSIEAVAQAMDYLTQLFR